MRFPTKIKNLNDTTITFELLPYQRKWLEEYKDKELTVTVTDKKDRSLLQNAKLWALVHEIDKEMNGYTSDQGEEDIYLQLIEMANIAPEYVQCIPEALKTLKTVYRVVKEVERRQKNGRESVVAKCYKGTSQFDTREMSDFIETTLRYASQAGINLHEYQDLRSS